MEKVHIKVIVGLDLGLCLQGHIKWVGDFSTLVGVYKDDNRLHEDVSPKGGPMHQVTNNKSHHCDENHNV
jgi:hypothetical protein